MSGLADKYLITKADGTPVDKNFYGFVLRLDPDGDPAFVNASIKALEVFAFNIRDANPHLAEDLFELCEHAKNNKGSELSCGDE